MEFNELKSRMPLQYFTGDTVIAVEQVKKAYHPRKYKEEDIMHKILIIEDDLVIAKGLQNHLCQWGYQVDYVNILI